jgi:hypothetical protein
VFQNPHLFTPLCGSAHFCVCRSQTPHTATLCTPPKGGYPIIARYRGGRGRPPRTNTLHRVAVAPLTLRPRKLSSFARSVLVQTQVWIKMCTNEPNSAIASSRPQPALSQLIPSDSGARTVAPKPQKRTHFPPPHSRVIARSDFLGATSQSLLGFELIGCEEKRDRDARSGLAMTVLVCAHLKSAKPNPFHSVSKSQQPLGFQRAAPINPQERKWLCFSNQTQFSPRTRGCQGRSHDIT